jgi:predicted enzyme related to lactoylglutathione lyase
MRNALVPEQRPARRATQDLDNVPRELPARRQRTAGRPVRGRAWRSAWCALGVNLDSMRVKGLVWLGIPAGDYAAAVRFFGTTLGLEVAFDEGNTAELTAGNGDRIQLFGPGHRSFEFYRSQGASIVPLLEVEDLDQASAEVVRGGAELLGEPESDGTWTWLTFQAPDGNIHSLGARQA